MGLSISNVRIGNTHIRAYAIANRGGSQGEGGEGGRNISHCIFIFRQKKRPRFTQREREREWNENLYRNFVNSLVLPGSRWALSFVWPCFFLFAWIGAFFYCNWDRVRGGMGVVGFVLPVCRISCSTVRWLRRANWQRMCLTIYEHTIFLSLSLSLSLSFAPSRVEHFLFLFQRFISLHSLSFIIFFFLFFI